MVYEGGCRCGAVRYRIGGDPLSAGYCRCRSCRHAAGAAVVAWVAFRRADFRFVAGRPHSRPAGRRAMRRFCPRCGSVLTFEYSAATETVDVTIDSLDDPCASDPVYQIWVSTRAEWLHAEDAPPAIPDRPAGPRLD